MGSVGALANEYHFPSNKSPTTIPDNSGAEVSVRQIRGRSHGDENANALGVWREASHDVRRRLQSFGSHRSSRVPGGVPRLHSGRMAASSASGSSKGMRGEFDTSSGSVIETGVPLGSPSTHSAREAGEIVGKMVGWLSSSTGLPLHLEGECDSEKSRQECKEESPVGQSCSGVLP